MPRVTTTLLASRQQLAQTATGVVTENVRTEALASTLAPASGSVFGFLVGLRAGDVATGLVLRVAVAASGTSATTVRMGLASSTGVMLVVSGNLNTAASWGIGAAGFPFSAPYTVPADGGYFACFVVNGTWGTTQPTLGRATAPAANTGTAFGTNAPPGFIWTGQTDLPAVGASLTMTSGNTQGFYVGVY